MNKFKSTQTWKPIVKFCSVKIFPVHNGIKLICRGSNRHYETLRAHAKQLKNDRFYLYQRQPIDISLEMIKNSTKTITYITRENFETVQALPINTTQKQDNKNQKQQTLEQKMVRFLRQHKFVIKKSFLDLHPYEAYHSLCSFLGVKNSQQITKIYHYCHFSKNEIKQSTVIYPFLNQLRHKYLNVGGQLKLRKLDRIRSATNQEVQQANKVWKSVFQVGQVYSSTKEQEQFKRKLVIEHNLGEFTKIQDLLEGYGQKSFYAAWKTQEPN